MVILHEFTKNMMMEFSIESILFHVRELIYI